MYRSFSPAKFAYVTFVLFSSLLISASGVVAQSVAVPSSAPVAEVKNTSSSLVASNLTGANSKAGRTDEASTAAAAEPKVSLQHPPLNLAITPSKTKLESLDIALSDDEYAPRGFSATAYSLRGRTRSGVYVRRGVIAADPRVLPLGTVVQLKAGNNYSGIYTVHDTGGVIKGKLIDIWMPSSREARRFGRQRVKLVVIQYPRGRKPAKK
ncbi:MAG TPA: 3D domain-containing protein [Blastocatellia bacterium]|nr:3D domain-containing protein [Blastocatellia bacterium]